jgi:hypothetical protein
MKNKEIGDAASATSDPNIEPVLLIPHTSVSFVTVATKSGEIRKRSFPKRAVFDHQVMVSKRNEAPASVRFRSTAPPFP